VVKWEGSLQVDRVQVVFVVALGVVPVARIVEIIANIAVFQPVVLVMQVAQMGRHIRVYFALPRNQMMRGFPWEHSSIQIVPTVSVETVPLQVRQYGDGLSLRVWLTERSSPQARTIRFLLLLVEMWQLPIS
jgi:hypothetical protein